MEEGRFIVTPILFCKYISSYDCLRQGWNSSGVLQNTMLLFEMWDHFLGEDCSPRYEFYTMCMCTYILCLLDDGEERVEYRIRNSLYRCILIRFTFEN